MEMRRSNKALIISILLFMAGTALSIILVSSPSEKLLGGEAIHRLHMAFHGLFAGIFMVTSTIGFYQAFRIWIGEAIRMGELQVGSFLNAFACFLTIVFGNQIYIPYRAAGGPRSYFLETSPEIHKIFFEFKEFTGLFTLPLAVAAAYLICVYGERLNDNKQLREIISVLLILVFFYFVIAFGLGAAITKLKSI